MYHIFPWVGCAVGVFIFCCEDEEGERGLGKHRFKTLLGRQPRWGFAIELVPVQVKSVSNEISKVLPSSGMPMSDEDFCTGWSKLLVLLWLRRVGSCRLLKEGFNLTNSFVRN